jgi:hypothetical protein
LSAFAGPAFGTVFVVFAGRDDALALEADFSIRAVGVVLTGWDNTFAILITLPAVGTIFVCFAGGDFALAIYTDLAFSAICVFLTGGTDTLAIVAAQARRTREIFVAGTGTTLAVFAGLTHGTIIICFATGVGTLTTGTDLTFGTGTVIVAGWIDTLAVLTDLAGGTVRVFFTTGVFALTVFADGALGTGDVVTGIVFAATVDTLFARRTLHVFATIPDALAVATNLTLWTFLFVAGIGETDTFLANLTFGAGDVYTGFDTFAFTTKLVLFALFVSTGVRLTLALDATLTIGTTTGIAVIGNTTAFLTELTAGTGQRLTNVNTGAVVASLAFLALDVFAGVIDTIAIVTDRTFWTLAVVAGSAAGTVAADPIVRTGAGIVVYIAITVVVFAVAGFLCGLWSITGPPATSFAKPLSFATIGFAGFDQTFIDDTITIVVFAITDLRIWLRSRAACPATVFAGRCS